MVANWKRILPVTLFSFKKSEAQRVARRSESLKTTGFIRFDKHFP
jgi:hypothetical protein